MKGEKKISIKSIKFHKNWKCTTGYGVIDFYKRGAATEDRDKKEKKSNRFGNYERQWTIINNNSSVRFLK